MTFKGFSPIRLFTQKSPKKVHQESGSSSHGEASSSSSSAAGRYPLCPVPEAGRKPSSTSAESGSSSPPKAIVEPSAPRGKKRGASAYRQLENVDGNIESAATTPEKPREKRTTQAVAAVKARRTTWQYKYPASHGLEIPSTSCVRRSPSFPRADSTEARGATSAPNFRMHLNNAGAGKTAAVVDQAPRAARIAVGKPPIDAADASRAATSSSSCSSTPSHSVTRSLRYGATSSSAAGAFAGSTAVSSSSAQGSHPSIGGKSAPPPCCIGYTSLEQHFDIQEDPTFWKDHNVQVIIRTRPISTSESAAHGFSRCVMQDSAHTVSWIGQPESRFTFDHVAGELITQEKLFRVAGVPMVENCMAGYNSCMFCYGQTGSGKTHTMLGDIADLEHCPSENRGIMPRLFEYLFCKIRTEEEARKQEHLKYVCKCSYLEIFNEQITDLLEPTSTNLQMREDGKKGVYVENLSEVEIGSVQDVVHLLLLGAANRKVAATNMNKESSRAHSVFTCIIESKWELNSMTNIRFGRLNLVDLAGSEWQKNSGAEGERLKEAANINKSLSTLGLVIMILVDVANGKQRHVPYRDSKLTFLLQDSLGGNSKTTIIANISPSSCCALETLSTLKFAQRAKFIRNNAVVNEDASRDVNGLRQEIQELKDELDRLRKEGVSRTPSMRSMASAAAHHSLIIGDHKLSMAMETVDGQEEQARRSLDSREYSKSLAGPQISDKKLKAMEAILAGALRREQVAEVSQKLLAAEIEQLDHLVKQREEDIQCSKMMLRFRDEKIKRLESLAARLLPAEGYLMQEKDSLVEELQVTQAKMHRNPELTRFAMENIRLLEQLRRFKDFYTGGEREAMAEEISDLRDQLLVVLDSRRSLDALTTPQREALAPELASAQREIELLHIEADTYRREAEDYRKKLSASLEANSRMSKQLDEAEAELQGVKSECRVYQEELRKVQEWALDLKAVERGCTQHMELIANLEDQLQQSEERAEREASVRSQLDAQLKASLQNACNLQAELQESRGALDAAETLVTRLQSAESRLAVVQETGASAQEAVDQIRRETKAMAEEQRLWVRNIEEAAVAARMKESELREELHEAHSLIERLLAKDGDPIVDCAAAPATVTEDRYMRSATTILQLQLDVESLEPALAAERALHRETVEKNDCIGQELEAVMEALENQNVAVVGELDGLQSKHQKALERLRWRVEERVGKELGEGKGDAVRRSQLERQLERPRRELAAELCDERNAQTVQKQEMDMVESEAAVITSLQEEIRGMKADVALAEQREAAATGRVAELVAELRSLELVVQTGKQESRNWVAQQEALLKEKDEAVAALQKDWEAAGARLLEHLDEGDSALTDAVHEMDGILDDAMAQTKGYDKEMQQLVHIGSPQTTAAACPKATKMAGNFHKTLRDAQHLVTVAEHQVTVLAAGSSRELTRLEHKAAVGEAKLRDLERSSAMSLIMLWWLLEKLPAGDPAKGMVRAQLEEREKDRPASSLRADPERDGAQLQEEALLLSELRREADQDWALLERGIAELQAELIGCEKARERLAMEKEQLVGRWAEDGAMWERSCTVASTMVWWLQMQMAADRELRSAGFDARLQDRDAVIASLRSELKRATTLLQERTEKLEMKERRMAELLQANEESDSENWKRDSEIEERGILGRRLSEEMSKREAAIAVKLQRVDAKVDGTHRRMPAVLAEMDMFTQVKEKLEDEVEHVEDECCLSMEEELERAQEEMAAVRRDAAELEWKARDVHEKLGMVMKELATSEEQGKLDRAALATENKRLKSCMACREMEESSLQGQKEALEASLREARERQSLMDATMGVLQRKLEALQEVRGQELAAVANYAALLQPMGELETWWAGERDWMSSDLAELSSEFLEMRSCTREMQAKLATAQLLLSDADVGMKDLLGRNAALECRNKLLGGEQEALQLELACRERCTSELHSSSGGARSPRNEYRSIAASEPGPAMARFDGLKREVGRMRMECENLRAQVLDTESTISSVQTELGAAIASSRRAALAAEGAARERQELEKQLIVVTRELADACDEVRRHTALSARCDDELRRVMQILKETEEMMDARAVEWRREREALVAERDAARLGAREKGCEAAALRWHCENGQATLQEAERLVDALVQANESAKRDAVDWKRKEAAMVRESGEMLALLEEKVSCMGHEERDIRSLGSEIREMRALLEGGRLDMAAGFCHELGAAAAEASLVDVEERMHRSAEVLHIVLMGTVASSTTASHAALEHKRHKTVTQHVKISRRESEATAYTNLQTVSDFETRSSQLEVAAQEGYNTKCKLERELESTAGELSKKDAMAAHLECLLEQSHAQNAQMVGSLQAASSRLEDERARLRETTCNLEDDGWELREAIDVRSRDESFPEMEKEMLQLQTELQEARAASLQRDLALEVLQHKRDRLLETVRDLEVEKRALEAESNRQARNSTDLAAQNANLERELQDARLAASRQELEVEIIATVLKSGAEESRERGAVAAHLENLLEQSHAQNARMLESSQELRAQLQACEGTLMALRTSSSQKDTEVSALQEEVEMLRSQEAVLEADLWEWQRRVQDAEGEVDEHNRTLASLRVELLGMQKDFKEEVKSADGQLQEFRQHISALERERDALVAELEGRSTVAAGLQYKLQRLEITMEEQVAAECVERDVAESLEREAAALRSAVKELKAEVAANRRRAADAERVLGEARLETEALARALQQKEDLLHGLEAGISLLRDSALQELDIKQEVESSRAATELLQRELELQKSRHTKLESELAQRADEAVRIQNHAAECEEKACTLETELETKRRVIESLEDELQMLEQNMAAALKDATGDLKEVEDERDQLHMELLVVTEQLEMAQAAADERDAAASEARMIAELSKGHAEEKEDEVKLLSRSVEELESTVYALESQLGLLKRDTEWHRLMREDMEMELQRLNNHMFMMQSALDEASACSAEELKEAQSARREAERNLEEREDEVLHLQRSLEDLHIASQEKDVQIKDAMAQISGLLLAAEMQTSDFQKKLKAMESTAEQAKAKVKDRKTHPDHTTPKSSEKVSTRVKGPGSPFKCLGAGLAQQMSSEIDAERFSYQRRIEELEALASSRQKEVSMLKTRLAEAESMTHDVLRDLLGVKLDITNVASMLGQHQVQQLAESARRKNAEMEAKELELSRLRSQIEDFIEERESWLEEINQRQCEMVAARVAAEQLRQREQALTDELEKCKAEGASQQERVKELELEVTENPAAQQSFQQRIKHHSKIKEENQSLRFENEKLGAKLRRTELLFARVNDDLARYRAAEGKTPLPNLDEEQRLRSLLQNAEEGRSETAQKLSSLCTAIMQAAGVPGSVEEVDPAAAMDALRLIEDRLHSTATELSDMRIKTKIAGEKKRLSELRAAHAAATAANNFTSQLQRVSSPSPPPR